MLHELMDAIGAAVAYEKGHTGAATTAEAALAAGRACARTIYLHRRRVLGLPARMSRAIC
jgi:hypothetical protein